MALVETFKSGDAVFFYNAQTGLENDDIHICFRRIEEEELCALKPGSVIWVDVNVERYGRYGGGIGGYVYHIFDSVSRVKRNRFCLVFKDGESMNVPDPRIVAVVDDEKRLEALVRANPECLEHAVL